MESSLALQFQGFLISVAAGVLLGAYYDIFRIYRIVFRPEKRAFFFQDLFYMGSAAFVTFLVTLGVNYGSVRFYILAGEGIGWCLYFMTAGLVTYQVFRFLSYVLSRFLIRPVRKLLRALLGWLGRRAGSAAKIMKNMAINLKKRLKHRASVVYNQFNAKRREKKLRARRKAALRRKKKLRARLRRRR